MASSIKLDMFTFTYLLSFSLLFVAALWVGDNGRSRAGVAKRGFARLPARRANRESSSQPPRRAGTS